MTKSRHILRPRRHWTDDEDQTVRDWYPWVPAQVVADAIGRPVGSVQQRAQKLGLRKSREVIAEIARARTGPDHPNVGYRWRPGTKPWNTGRKGVTGMHERSRAHQFRPGNRPWTWLPVGSFRVNADGILEQKYADDPGPPKARWRAYTRIVWEQAHGAIPNGHAVVFRPGRHTTDPAQVTLAAIECISRAELMARNTVHRYPKEIAGLVKLRGALNRQINAKAREAA